MNDLKSKSNIKLMKRVLTTYELRKYLKKYFCLTLDNYLVLAYLDVFKNDEGKYFMRDIISYIGIDQSRIVVNSGLKMLFYGGLKMSFFSGLRLSYI
ncbi:hypothetical protein [Staphylococcus aureus]|uniref:hypothetical protein n=1 Tax=Staphylococcus aureus TaxID=1280 RepID=UPI0005E54516|nr:hypothetical protein [Staphylococcus aureus]CAC7436238.1 Transcriptional regulator SarT (Staphylococcal accessory regulator T) [Staphylococcus aureus]CPJ12603.1 Transcriptional regulator SarT (Staphylococcal accessory regulator T) [Staphylococcus aureus]